MSSGHLSAQSPWTLCGILVYYLPSEMTLLSWFQLFFFHFHDFIFIFIDLPFPSLSRDLNPLLSLKYVILSLDLLFILSDFFFCRIHPQRWPQVSTKYLWFSHLIYIYSPHFSTYNFHIPTKLISIRTETISSFSLI